MVRHYNLFVSRTLGRTTQPLLKDFLHYKYGPGSPSHVSDFFLVPPFSRGPFPFLSVSRILGPVRPDADVVSSTAAPNPLSSCPESGVPIPTPIKGLSFLGLFEDLSPPYQSHAIQGYLP